MFTGLIEEVGRVISARRTPAGMKLSVKPENIHRAAEPGDSISVNGVCLTAAETGNRGLSFDVVRETLEDTTLSGLRPGEKVNLERALAADSRLGGHFVYGHVDGTGVIIGKSRQTLAIRVPERLSVHIFPKASIAVDGISLTIQSARPPEAEIAVIPATWLNTNLGFKKAGDAVNIEIDMIMKQVMAFFKENSMQFPENPDGFRSNKKDY